MQNLDLSDYASLKLMTGPLENQLMERQALHQLSGKAATTEVLDRSVRSMPPWHLVMSSYATSNMKWNLVLKQAMPWCSLPHSACNPS